MYQGCGIVGDVRDDKTVPVLLFVFNEGIVVVESTSAQLLASKKTDIFKEFDTWRFIYDRGAKKLDFAAFGAHVQLPDTLVTSWPKATLTSVKWHKAGGFCSTRMLSILRTNGSSKDLVSYGAGVRHNELFILNEACKRALGFRYHNS